MFFFYVYAVLTTDVGELFIGPLTLVRHIWLHVQPMRQGYTGVLLQNAHSSFGLRVSAWVLIQNATRTLHESLGAPTPVSCTRESELLMIQVESRV